MMVWPFQWFTPPLAKPPPLPDPGDTYYDIELQAAHLLKSVQGALEQDPTNEYLEIARNQASDTFVTICRANAHVKKAHT
jgi:hypothetical protein